jgi:hypothetical protein
LYDSNLVCFGSQATRGELGASGMLTSL